MKKSVKTFIHLGFWLYFPLSNAFSSWSKQFGFSWWEKDIKSIFQILSENIQFLFTPMDVGREIWSVSNLFGIIFHLYVYIILPICIFYIFYGIIIPKYLKYGVTKKVLFPFIVWLIIPFVITTLFRFVTIAVAWSYTHSITLTFIHVVQFALLGSLFRIFEVWILSEKRSKQNLQSELTLLKHQINPHFLFNTLNNIDSLIKSNVGKASETLVKLSDILRYMVYDTNVEKVQLSNEIKNIESFIDLQKIQFANKELVSFSSIGNMESIYITPMLFIPFVENAFKHCNNKNIQNAIQITFKIENKIIHFECINVFDKSIQISKDNTSGVGLNLVRRRLELLYPKHSLIIKEENNTFKVSLLLNTDEY